MNRAAPLSLLFVLISCGKGPVASVVVVADQDATQVASLRRGLDSLAGGKGSRREAIHEEDGTVGNPVRGLSSSLVVVKDAAEAQEKLAELARKGMAIAASPGLAQAAGNAAVVVPGRVATLGFSRDAGSAAQAWISTDQAGYLAGWAAAAASKKNIIGLVMTGGIEEDVFARAFRFGASNRIDVDTHILMRWPRSPTREAAAAEVGSLAAQGADVVAVTGSSEVGRGAILEATTRGFEVVLPDERLTSVAGPLLAAQVTVPWARLVYELVAHAEGGRPRTARVALKDGWNGLVLGPALQTNPEAAGRLAELRRGLVSGELHTDRAAPGAHTAVLEKPQAKLGVWPLDSRPGPVFHSLPPTTKIPGRTDLGPWDGKAR